VVVAGTTGEYGTFDTLRMAGALANLAAPVA
jgi:hypothetical protein